MVLLSIALIEEEHKLTFGPLIHYFVVYYIFLESRKCILVNLHLIMIEDEILFNPNLVNT